MMSPSIQNTNKYVRKQININKMSSGINKNKYTNTYVDKH